MEHGGVLHSFSDDIASELRLAEAMDVRRPPQTRVLLLVGIPGSGKSTFAHDLERENW